MLGLRAPLVAAALGGGLALGALAWLALGRGTAMLAEMDALQDRLAALHAAPRSIGAGGSDPGAIAVASPLFALTTGPGAVADIALKLEGLSKTPTRSAALVSIDGKPSAWLALGETREGVTLQSVAGDSAIFDTALGLKTVAIGQASAAAAPAAGSASAAPSPSSSAAPPAGYRMPPPPASAPTGG